MPKRKALTDILRGVMRFGRLTVVGEAPDIISPSGYSARAARVQCECGENLIVRAGDLRNGYTSSCGCLQRELTAIKIAERSRRHGQSSKLRVTAEYRAWNGMKTRCCNPRAPQFSQYGARGISVCERWTNSFENFYDDMGRRPSPKHSLDRIDNSKGYSPQNCRWATQSEQAINRRSSTLLTINGRTQTVIEWAREAGVDPMPIYQRLKKGWLPERAVFTPKRGKATIS